MKLPFLLLFLPLLLSAQYQYPPTRRVAVTDTIHGAVIPDPYRWLENDRDPEVEAWVAKQAAVTSAYLNKIPYREALLNRLDELTNVVSYSAPWHRKGRTFFYKNTGQQNHAVLYMQNDGSTEAEVLLDPNTFSADGTVGLAFAEESNDGRYIAFGKSVGGSDWHDIFIMEIASRQLLPEVIKWVKNGGVNWYKDGFYYSRYATDTTREASLTEKNTHQSVFYHRVGSEQKQDKLIFADPSNPDQFVGCYVMERSRFLIRWMRSASSNGNEIFMALADDAVPAWKKVYSSQTDAFFPSYDHNDKIYGTTTESAPNGKVVRVVDPLGTAKFEDVVNERPIVLEGCSFGGGKMFVTWMKDVRHEVEIMDFDGAVIGTVALPGPGAVGGFNGYPEDTTLYYTFTSHTYPTTIFSYNVKSGASTVWQRIKANFNPEDFSSEQVFVTSKDGARIPMFVLSKKGSARTGDAPTILYGYGGFNVSLNPSFNPNIIPWLEQGGVMVIANLRGGGEYGEDWHRAGMRLNKQNVFNDAIACAEWLITNRITNSSKLAINGGSNGGLLVGAVVNQRPDLFRVAVPEVGVMDMLRFHLFTIGWNWQSDYGDIANAEEFEVLRGYSPYHQLKPNVEYPSTMILTADHDDRVVPAHSFKYAAMLQHVYSGSRPMLLRVEVKSGHGAVNRKKRLEGSADKYSFIWHEMGLEPRIISR